MWRSEQLCGRQASPPTFMWVPGTDLGKQAWAAGAFPHWATSPPAPTSYPPPLWFLLRLFLYSVCVCFCAHTCHGQVWRWEDNSQESVLPFTLLIGRSKPGSSLAASILYRELVCFFEIRSSCIPLDGMASLYIKQTGLELKVILLLHLPKC